jgi:signal transduction histidine kinase
MASDMKNGFDAILRRYAELDSIYGLMQDANFNQMASETALLRSQEEAAANKKLASRLTYWLIGMTAVFLFVYIMGRRRLMLKIWARGRELKAALSRAEESDQMKSAFIRHMSHEIRTPLNAVSGFSQVLTSPDYNLSDEERIDMQHRISDNVNLITTIVNELLELSKSESEGADTEIVKTDIKCNEFCRLLLEERKDNGNPLVELRFASNVGDDYTFHTNVYRLRTSLGHLLDNAQKFTDIGHIELKVEVRAPLLVFSVTDTGVGIDVKNRETIFEDFSKLDSFKEGIGLGLPITRRLITSLGGMVELDSTYTRGSRFVITFQIA